MSITEEQKERANTVNLPQFLMSHGFDLKRVGREYVWKEHDSLFIKDNGPGERGQWYRFSEDKGGDNIGFLREYMGMSFKEAVEALSGESCDISYTAPQRKPEKPKQTGISVSEAPDAKRVIAYLCKTRGLDYGMVSALIKEGRIAQEQKTGNVLFKYHDEKGKLIGAEKVGTSTAHKFKGIVTGSASGHGFEVTRGKAERAYFFESAIDMLSFLQMHKDIVNCRLVSMMGVKPNIVLETMERHHIPPEKVFLCSDNDRAGNVFAEKLMDMYPQMQRFVTQDAFKDWNDQLRGIPKERTADRLVTYGNKLWNDATDNRDKTVITISSEDFMKLRERLDSAAMNYYAYEKNGEVVMAINDHDAELLQRLAETELSVSKSDRTYFPPDRNIIGNADYRSIGDKEFVSADRDTILKMADIMQKDGIAFSGRIYPSGKGTLTVSHDDLEAVIGIQTRVTRMRESVKEPTEEEKQFLKADMAMFIAESALSSDEWEDMAYPLFEDGYIEKYKPHEKAVLGNGLHEPMLYELAGMMHHGEDIRAELAKALLNMHGKTSMEFAFKDDGTITDRTLLLPKDSVHTVHIEVGDDTVRFSYEGARKEISFTEIGQAFLDRTEEEYRDIVSYREEEARSEGTFKVMQLAHPKDGEDDPYHGIRFFGKAENEQFGVHLNHEDYTQVYEGRLADYPAQGMLEAIYFRMNNSEKPEGYTGHSLSVSDVIVISIDGKETAYYCDPFGFTEMPEYFLDKPIEQGKAPTVDDLSVGDIILLDGARMEVEAIDEKHLDLRNLDLPPNPVLLSTNDVFAFDGWQDTINAKGFTILQKAEASQPKVGYFDKSKRQREVRRVADKKTKSTHDEVKKKLGIE